MEGLLYATVHAYEHYPPPRAINNAAFMRIKVSLLQGLHHANSIIHSYL